nr:hypothetical protein [Tanacetum cinerariifolium]
MIGLEMEQETTKVVMIKERLKEAKDRQGVVRFGKKYELAPRTGFPKGGDTVTTVRRQNKRRTPNVVEPELRTIVEVAPMADNRTMEELLQAPTEEYGEAIVILEINADHFEIKTNLLQLVQANPYHDSLNVAAGENLLSKTTREALNIIENKSKVRYSINKPNVSRMNITSRENASKTDDRIDKLGDQILTLVDIFAKKVITPALVKAIEESCVTCGGPHANYNCDATNSNQPSVCVAMSTYNQVAPQNRARNYMAPPGFAPVQHSQNRYNQGQGNNFNRGNNFHSNQSFQVPNQGIQSQPFQVPNNQVQQAITTRSDVAYEGPSIPTNPSPKKVVEQETEETTDKEQTNFQGSTAHIHPPVTLILEPNVLKTLPKPNISYPSRLNDQKLLEKATNQMEKFFQIFQDFHFDLCSSKSFLKSLEILANFLYHVISGMDVCHALADLDASINLMPLSIWKKLSLPELAPTRMILELANRSITRPKGVTEDVFVKVGKFHFPTDFVVVDFEADPRIPLILRRSFLRTGCALIDVYREEITLRRGVCSRNLAFSKNSLGGNPTSTSEPILFNSSPSLTSFEGSDFILEETKAYLKDELISPEIDHADCDPEGNICLIEKLLNNEPFQLPSMDLKQGEVVKKKSSIEEPPELELKDLPSHLEYAYLEGADKLSVIVAKDLKDDEKEALLKVLKSHKRAIAWKITDIKGIDPRFCTHKILMDEDCKPVVQS